MFVIDTKHWLIVIYKWPVDAFPVLCMLAVRVEVIVMNRGRRWQQEAVMEGLFESGLQKPSLPKKKVIVYL